MRDYLDESFFGNELFEQYLEKSEEQCSDQEKWVQRAHKEWRTNVEELYELTGLEEKVTCGITEDFVLLLRTGAELTEEQVDVLYAIEKVNREELDQRNQRKWNEDLERCFELRFL